MKHRIALILGLSLATAQLFAQATPTPQATLTPELKQQVLDGITRIIKNTAFVPGHDLTQWDTYLAENRTKIDEAKTDNEFATAVRGTLQKFGVSHLVLMTPQAAKARVERKSVGIGINIQPGDEGLLITNVFPGSPADEAGLKPGDTLIEADGKKLGKDSTVSGEEGTKLTLKVKKPTGEVKKLELTRRKFSTIRTDTLTWNGSDTAVLKVHTFDLSYDRKKIDELMTEAAKAKNLILDLRSNGGGAVVNMLHLLGHFIDSDQQFGIFISKSMVSRYVKETEGSPTELNKIAQWSKSGWLRPISAAKGPFKGNVFVLINGGSGSASEITAQALRELANAPVIGSKSAGAVLVSTMAPLAGGWQLQYPLSDYLSKEGVRLEGNGIVPDLEAAAPVFGQKDEAIEKSLALIRRNELRKERFGGSEKPIFAWL